MKILFMGNNRIGFEILRWLKDQGEDLVGLVLHPIEERKFGKEMLQVIDAGEQDVILGSRLKEKAVIDHIKALAPDVILSILFNYILKPDIIQIPRNGCVNLHPALLPYNRGQYPNVWSIIEKTPSGVTLHYIDEHIDTGDIIAQLEVPVTPIDTGATLYRKLEDASLELFKNNWHLIKSGCAPRVPQDMTRGTYHRTKDVEKIDFIDLDATYTGRQVIDLLRARTYAPYKGAYVEENGRRIYLRLELIDEKDI